MDEKGTVLKHNNEQIVKCLEELRRQREEINLLILRQRDERETLTLEAERVKYKINLITKSLAQRLAARDKYDQTIREAEAYYQNLVERSAILLGAVKKDANALEECIDKKSGGTETINAPLLHISPIRNTSAPLKPRTSSSLYMERIKQQGSISRYKQTSQPIIIYETIKQLSSTASIGTVTTLKSANNPKPHSSNTAIYPGTYYPELSTSESYDTT